MEHGIASPQSQGPADVGIGAKALAVNDFALGGAFAFGVALIGQQFQKTVLNLLLGMRGHKSAFALAPNQQIVIGQFIDGFAHGALADAVPGRQIHFTGDAFARLPFARLKALQNQALDLLIQGAECWRRG